MKTANYPIVVGDVLTAGTEAFKIKDVDTEEPAIGIVLLDALGDEVSPVNYMYTSIVQAIGTVDPKTGTPRV